MDDALSAVGITQDRRGLAVDAGRFGFGKFVPGGTWQDESYLGDAWLQVSGTLT